jgi:NADH-quinone oxidoreductase subunit E
MTAMLPEGMSSNVLSPTSFASLFDLPAFGGKPLDPAAFGFAAFDPARFDWMKMMVPGADAAPAAGWGFPMMQPSELVQEVAKAQAAAVRAWWTLAMLPFGQPVPRLMLPAPAANPPAEAAAAPVVTTKLAVEKAVVEKPLPKAAVVATPVVAQRAVAPAVMAPVAPAVEPAPKAPAQPEPIVLDAGTTDAGDELPGEAPELFSKPKGEPDDLLLIKGIGAKLGALLNEIGVWHYSQIAGWTAAEVAWVNDKIAFKGRIQREEWIRQAKTLLAAKLAGRSVTAAALPMKGDPRVGNKDVGKTNAGKTGVGKTGVGKKAAGKPGASKR